MERDHFRLDPHKIEAVIMKKPRERDGIQFTIGYSTVTSQRPSKSLGIWLDDELDSNKCIQKVTKEARRIATMSKIMPNIGGPMPETGPTLGVQEHAGDFTKNGTSKGGPCIHSNMDQGSPSKCCAAPIDQRVIVKTGTFGEGREFLDKAKKRERNRSIVRWQQRRNDTRE
ncbi:hypothetical protein JTB14_031582 [Gonioctena quinquepunctata]|nr:hypothetical protein JTB14_031582 [Gonioctena quinquepunctata]